MDREIGAYRLHTPANVSMSTLLLYVLLLSSSSRACHFLGRRVVETSYPVVTLTHSYAPPRCNDGRHKSSFKVRKGVRAR